jgi:hypothetical protein
MAKTGQQLKIEKRWNIVVWASNAVYALLMILPGWELRMQALADVTTRLQGIREWEKRNNGRKIKVGYGSNWEEAK